MFCLINLIIKTLMHAYLQSIYICDLSKSHNKYISILFNVNIYYYVIIFVFLLYII